MVAPRSIVALGLAACAAHAAHTIPVAVLTSDGASTPAADAIAGLALAPLVPPAAPPSRVDLGSAIVVRARSAYASGDFGTCRTETAKFDVTGALALDERATAARALLLDGACAWGATDRAAATAIAARFASLGLELPDMIVSPDVERVFGDAITAAGAAPRSTLAVAGQPGARISLDGREPSCVVPCTLDVAPGDHVLAANADGFEPAAMVVRAPSARVAIEQHRAPAALAAAQWRARVAHGLPAADELGARLVGAFASTERVAYLEGTHHLTGALVVDGKLVATASGGDPAGLVRELAYDGGVLARPSVWQRPWVWIAATTVAGAIAGTIWYFNRPVRTDLGFGP